MSQDIFKEKTDLNPSEYKNLFGDPFWSEKGSSKAKDFYLQLNDRDKALMLKKNYLEMIEKARQRNFNMAADCLQWWLGGTGFTKTINFNWLRRNNEVIVAERVNLERFEKDEDAKFGLFLLTLPEGETKHFTTYHDKQVRAGIFGELYYASGNSILKSTCHFKVAKKGSNNYKLSGTIIHSWNDRYDWHKGASAYIFGFGNIGDSEALLVEKYCGAKPFEMRSEWKQNFNRTFQRNSSGDLILKLK